MGKKGRTPKALSTRGLGQHAENLKIKGHATLLEQKFDFQSAIAETRIPQKLLAFRAYNINWYVMSHLATKDSKL